MKILITGGAGMVGSHAAEYYAQRGDDVIIFDNLMRSQLFGYNQETVIYNWNYLKKYKNITHVLGDVRNKQQVLDVLDADIDAIIHTAGQPGVELSMRKPLEDFDINALGTLMVLECARNVCPKAGFILCSTNKVYGENITGDFIEEPTRWVYKDFQGIDEKLKIDHTGHTPYGASKLSADLYVQEYRWLYKMNTAVFRMSCTYGTRQFGFEDQGWLAWFVIANLKRKPIYIYGDGKQVRDVLFVTDLIHAFDQFLNAGYQKNDAIFNVGGGLKNEISLIEFIDLVEKKTGQKFVSINYKPWRPSDQKIYISNTEKLENEFNWKPEVSLSDGVDRLIDWVQNNLEVL